MLPRLFGAAAALLLASSVNHAAAGEFVWPNVPDRLERSLESADPSERRKAAKELGELPREMAAPLVRKAISDDDPDVRIAAARVAARLRLENIGDLVVPWLADTGTGLKIAACEVIRVSPTQAAISALGRVLADQSPQVRFAAAQALGASESPEAVSFLLGHLDDQAPEVRAEVARGLSRLADTRAVLPLVGKIQDSSSEVRRAVSRALGDLKDARAVPALVLATQDASLDVRLEAVTALGKVGSDQAIAPLSPFAEGQGDAGTGSVAPATEAVEAMRRAALDSLARIGSPRAIAVLLQALLRDQPGAERTPARDALARIGPAVVPSLVAFIEGGPAPDAAASSALALSDIGAIDSAPTLIKAMQRGSLPLLPGLQALAKLDHPDALPFVLELLESQDPKVRRQAIDTARALTNAKHPDGRAVEPVRSALAESRLDIDERVALIDLLGRTGAARAETTLLGFTQSKSTAVRRESVRALGNLGTGTAAIDRALLAALDDEAGPIRIAAALSLGRVATPATVEPLLKRLLDAAEQDRGAIGLALSGVLDRSRTDAVAERVAAAVTSAPETARDALLEGLGRMQTPKSAALLEPFASGSLDDRRKVAEVLSPVSGGALLVKLARDAEASVRANAAWSLGAPQSSAVGLPELQTLLRDVDGAVAANAAASLGRRLAGAKATTPPAVARALCAALDDTRPFVRANALISASVAKAQCELKVLTRLLRQDPSDRVRSAAAKHLKTRSEPAAKQALERCIAEDATPSVARACTGSRLAVEETRDTFVAFVVPDGFDAPVARAPFALLLPDAAVRVGLADRRGAVFVQSAPSGVVELLPPAP